MFIVIFFLKYTYFVDFCKSFFTNKVCLMPLCTIAQRKMLRNKTEMFHLSHVVTAGVSRCESDSHPSLSLHEAHGEDMRCRQNVTFLILWILWHGVYEERSSSPAQRSLALIGSSLRDWEERESMRERRKREKKKMRERVPLFQFHFDRMDLIFGDLNFLF